MAQRSAQPGVSKRLALVLVALLVVGAVVGLIAILTGDDDDDEDASGATTSTTSTVPLTGDAKDLVSRLEAGRDAKVHVHLASAAGAIGGGTVAVEIWRDGDLVRQDVRLEGPDSFTEVSAFQLADGNVVCQRTAADAPFECQRAVSVGSEDGDPVGLIEAAAANLQTAEVTATDEEINDTPVRCYSIDRPEGASALCLTEDGVPMALSTRGQELRATTVDDEVPAEVFEPPAEITEG